jgi:hypothetical protein
VSRGFVVALGAIAAAAGGWWWWSTKEGAVQSLADKLIDVLPSRLGQWAEQLARGALDTAPASMNPLKWALFAAAVMDRESNGGSQLRPHGAGGSGDFTARRGTWLSRTDIAKVVQVVPAGWYPPRSGDGLPLSGPYAIPIDEQGWGRGLMQLDVGTYPELIGQTLDAQSQVRRAMLQLRGLFLKLDSSMDEEQRLQRTAAAYNAGPRALTSDDPDRFTTGGNYGSDVLQRAASWEA